MYGLIILIVVAANILLGFLNISIFIEKETFINLFVALISLYVANYVCMLYIIESHDKR